MQRPNVMRVFGIGLLGLAVLLTAAIAQAGYMTDIIDSNPLGYWRLDDASGSASAANKISGGIAGTYNNFEAADYGKPGAIKGDSDTAAGFDGSNNYISIAESAVSTVGTGAFSVEMWFNTSTSNRSDLFNYKGGDTDMGLFTDSGVLAFWSTAASKYASGTTVLSPNTWYHIVLTRDATSNINAYVNGQFQFSVSGSTENFGSVGHNIWIGANHDGNDNPSFPVSGSIDEVAIYGSAMSQPTALAHYNAGIPVPEPSTAILLGSALIGLICYAWRKRK